jgi:hypothetical protein
MQANSVSSGSWGSELLNITMFMKQAKLGKPRPRIPHCGTLAYRVLLHATALVLGAPYFSYHFQSKISGRILKTVEEQHCIFCRAHEAREKARH